MNYIFSKGRKPCLCSQYAFPLERRTVSIWWKIGMRSEIEFWSAKKCNLNSKWKARDHLHQHNYLNPPPTFHATISEHFHFPYAITYCPFPAISVSKARTFKRKKKPNFFFTASVNLTLRIQSTKMDKSVLLIPPLSNSTASQEEDSVGKGLMWFRVSLWCGWRARWSFM